MSRYGVSVGQRWSNVEGRLQDLPVVLEADQALEAVHLAGFEIALLVPEELIPHDGSKLPVKPRARLVLVELDTKPRPEPKA